MLLIWHCHYFLQPGESIQLQTAVGSQAAEASGSSRSSADKTAMVRAARQLLSAITKVLLLADRIVIKQLICSKDRVGTGWSACDLLPGFCTHSRVFVYMVAVENVSKCLSEAAVLVVFSFYLTAFCGE